MLNTKLLSSICTENSYQPKWQMKTYWCVWLLETNPKISSFHSSKCVMCVIYNIYKIYHNFITCLTFWLDFVHPTGLRISDPYFREPCSLYIYHKLFRTFCLAVYCLTFLLLTTICKCESINVDLCVSSILSPAQT